MLENGGQHYRNYSGCGNTLNGNHPIVREMIFHCLRHWVHNYHVDGFRFDLASILSRDREGNLVPNPPVVESIAEDPLLADTKIIAEAWDAAGAYQVGTFGSLRWAEWNGRYRDDLRRFWRGDPHMIGPLATRLAGSSDLYQASGRRPYHSINFITSHDGFTLNDLVSYNHKHNEANGEGNRDGDNNNFSCNYGVEGPTHPPLRRDRPPAADQEHAGHAAVEPGRADAPRSATSAAAPSRATTTPTARTTPSPGSTGGWCRSTSSCCRFCQALVAFRRAEPTVRRTDFLTGRPVRPGGLPDVSWYTPAGGAGGLVRRRQQPGVPAWRPRRGATCSDPPNHHVLIMLHAGAEPQQVRDSQGRPRHALVAVHQHGRPPARDDIYPDLDGPPPPAERRR